jgi:hypothetical protein
MRACRRVATNIAKLPAGGYQLARDRHGVTANDILRAAGTVHEAGEEPSSELVAKVVLPVLSVAEQEFGQVLGRISLDDMVQRAALNGNGTGRRVDGRGSWHRDEFGSKPLYIPDRRKKTRGSCPCHRLGGSLGTNPRRASGQFWQQSRPPDCQWVFPIGSPVEHPANCASGCFLDFSPRHCQFFEVRTPTQQ